MRIVKIPNIKEGKVIVELPNGEQVIMTFQEFNLKMKEAKKDEQKRV